MALAEEIMEDHEKCKVDVLIVEFISKSLLVCANHVSRKAIMGKVFSHYKVRDNVPNYIMLPKVAIIQQEVIIGVNKALEENELSNRKVWLATKHAFLTIVVSAHSKSTMYTIWDCKNLWRSC
jgi:hypothetical protein